MSSSSAIENASIAAAKVRSAKMMAACRSRNEAAWVMASANRCVSSERNFYVRRMASRQPAKLLQIRSKRIPAVLGVPLPSQQESPTSG
ncbi:hypothetical protein [Bradyrhizobium sp. USDA 4486]